MKLKHTVQASRGFPRAMERMDRGMHRGIDQDLENANDKLQSINQELVTIGEELRHRDAQMNKVTDDLANFLASVDIPIVMVGVDARIRHFTSEAGKTLQLASTDLGRPIAEIRPDIGVRNLGKLVREVMHSLVTKELEIQDRAGRWFRLQIRPYRNTDNSVGGAVIALIDIDGLKQVAACLKIARDEAERANRIKDEFLATLSHELRTPLTGILGWAQELQARKIDSTAIAQGLPVIERSAKILGELVNDLLDVSKIQAGKLSLDIRAIEVSPILNAAVDAARKLAEEKSIEIELKFKVPDCKVFADPLRLQQVFWNLLTNAVKFTPQGGNIFVTLKTLDSPDGRFAQIQIADTGIGIKHEFLTHIFERFTQADSALSRVHGGLGLGLSIVHSLVEMLDGKITAESEGEGKGTSFTITLPLILNNEIASEKIPSFDTPANHCERLKGLKVLVVDDDASNRDLFSILLESFGAKICLAESAKEALREMSDFKPDLLLSDISMPGEDGYALIRKVRSLPVDQGGKIPAIALTAYAGADNVRLAVAAGFSAHIAKPVDRSQLAEGIAKVMNEAF